MKVELPYLMLFVHIPYNRENKVNSCIQRTRVLSEEKGQKDTPLLSKSRV